MIFLLGLGNLYNQVIFVAMRTRCKLTKVATTPLMDNYSPLYSVVTVYIAMIDLTFGHLGNLYSITEVI